MNSRSRCSFESGLCFTTSCLCCSICVFAHSGFLFVFIVMSFSVVWIYHSLFMHSNVDTHLGFVFRSGAIMHHLLHVFGQTRALTYLGCVPGVDLLDHNVWLCAYHQQVPSQLSKVFVLFFTPTNNVQQFQFLHQLLVCTFHFSHSHGDEWRLVVLSSISLMTNDAEHLSRACINWWW